MISKIRANERPRLSKFLATGAVLLSIARPRTSNAEKGIRRREAELPAPLPLDRTTRRVQRRSARCAPGIHQWTRREPAPRWRLRLQRSESGATQHRVQSRASDPAAEHPATEKGSTLLRPARIRPRALC